MVALLLKACVGALHAFPRLQLARSTATSSSSSATTTSASRPTRRNGLVVPVIRDVDQQGPARARRRADRAVGQGARGQARGRRRCSGGTFTISSLGGIGGTASRRSSTRREVAILGVVRVGDEAGVERQRVRAAADAAALAVLRPPRDRRRRRGALLRAPRRRARPTCGGCCSERRSTSSSPTSATSPTSRSSRSWSRPATRSRRRTRSSCWSPTRRRWRSRRRGGHGRAS